MTTRATTVAVIVVLVVGGAAMLVAGASPLAGFAALLTGSLRGPHEIGETLLQTAALLFPALGVALAFRAGLFNIGAEGQLLLGGLAAGVIGALTAFPGWAEIPLLLLAGACAGGAWAAIAGFARARFGANEVIATLMLNVVATLLAGYLVAGPLKLPGAVSGETPPIATSAYLPVLIPQTRATLGILIAITLAGVMQVTIARTVFGYELRAVGANPEAARRAGINVAQTTFLAMTFSGAIAGIGGAAFVLGVLHRFNTSLSPGYGFIGIAVALVGGLDPLRIVAAALVFGILQSGAIAMQAEAHVPRDVVTIIEGLLIVVLAGGRYRSVLAHR